MHGLTVVTSSNAEGSVRRAPQGFLRFHRRQSIPRKARGDQTPNSTLSARRTACRTSNQSFDAWGDVFGDRVIGTAILDRILHHAITINVRGNSYLLKDKLKAGLVRPEEATA